MKQNELESQLLSIKEYADSQPTLTALENMLLNLCENLIELNNSLLTQIQSLKNEINQLKGEQGQPKIRKQSSSDHSSENERKKRTSTKKRRKRKKSKATVKHDRKEYLTLAKDELPDDAVRDGVERRIIQDISISTNNVLFIRQRYYSPSNNQYYIAPYPPGFEGGFGPNIKAWSNTLYASQEMTTANITQLFTDAGVLISKSTVNQFITTFGQGRIQL